MLESSAAKAGRRNHLCLGNCEDRSWRRKKKSRKRVGISEIDVVHGCLKTRRYTHTQYWPMKEVLSHFVSDFWSAKIAVF